MVKSHASLEPARFVVGIDLGTTNSAVCYIDTLLDASNIQTFLIPQHVGIGLVEARETLPSFHYQAGENEFPEMFAAFNTAKKGKSLRKRERYFVGTFARDHGANVPDRLINSAKSWLCHSGVDRTAPLLPWQAGPEIEKLSPVTVSARYLEHLRESWDHAFPLYPLAEQDVIITLPASFDEVARELTISAAKQAGLSKIVLLEEPQAVFYAFLGKHSCDKPEMRIGNSKKHAPLPETEPTLLYSERLKIPVFDSTKPDNDGHLLKPKTTADTGFGIFNDSSTLPKILVCDVGGGTTDLTLIRVRKTESGQIRFHRVAVGEHLILGGDNLDLALAHHVQSRLIEERRLPKNSETENETRLPVRIWSVLVRLCCQIKELMLGENAPEKTTLHLPGLGTKLIGGGLRIEITREEVRRILLDGFFPRVPLSSIPSRYQSGFREFGLPYASDAAITKHLARFLSVHRHSGDEPDDTVAEGIDPARPDWVLFNGGVFAATSLQQRLVAVLEDWFRTGPSDSWSPTVLENPRLDLSVARGAAYYGMVRRGTGQRISASLARTYYVGVENPVDRSVQAICLLPANAEPDHPVVLERPLFELLIGTPVSFPLFVSSVRLTDRPGGTVETDREQLTPLPPIRTVLKTRRKKQEMIRVRLGGRLTEIGTLELFAEEIPEAAGKTTAKKGLTWKLEFDVRSATQTEYQAHESAAEQDGFWDESIWEEMEDSVRRTFSVNSDPIKPSELVKQLTVSSQMERADWPTSLLRKLGESLLLWESGRKISAEHESRWLNLLGYAYRPGFGFAMDDWRIDQFWKMVQGSLIHKTQSVRIQWWVLIRRIAGGLTPGQQQSLADPILLNIRALHKQILEGRGRGSDLDLTTQEGAEIWRMLGALESLPLETKTELGRMILDLATKKRMEPVYDAMIWSVGRIGARSLLSGPLNTIVATKTVEDWIGRRIKEGKDRPTDHFAIMELARKTEDRYRDVSESIRMKAAAHLRKTNAPDRFVRLIEHSDSMDESERGMVFGESLPIGLRIASCDENSQ